MDGCYESCVIGCVNSLGLPRLVYHLIQWSFKITNFCPDLLVLLEDCHCRANAPSAPPASVRLHPAPVEEYLRLERGGDDHLEIIKVKSNVKMY